MKGNRLNIVFTMELLNLGLKTKKSFCGTKKIVKFCCYCFETLLIYCAVRDCIKSKKLIGYAMLIRTKKRNKKNRIFCSKKKIKGGNTIMLFKKSWSIKRRVPQWGNGAGVGAPPHSIFSQFCPRKLGHLLPCTGAPSCLILFGFIVRYFRR